MNRLSLETSPYLRQHAGNPVDWYPWGEEALQRVLARGCWTPVLGFGAKKEEPGMLRARGEPQAFDVLRGSLKLAHVDWTQLGEHNQLNALAAIGAALVLLGLSAAIWGPWVERTGARTAGRLAAICFAVIQIHSFRELGLGGWLEHLCGGSDLVRGPKGLYLVIPVIFVVEFLGLFIKPIALAIRLFANMVGGHTLMATLLMFGMMAAKGGLATWAVAHWLASRAMRLRCHCSSQLAGSVGQRCSTANAARRAARSAGSMPRTSAPFMSSPRASSATSRARC